MDSEDIETIKSYDTNRKINQSGALALVSANKVKEVFKKFINKNIVLKKILKLMMKF